MAISRVYIHSSIKEEFLALYQKEMGLFGSKIGNASHSETTHGPQADVLQYERIKKFLEAGKTEGKTLIGGNAVDGEVRIGYDFSLPFITNPMRTRDISSSPPSLLTSMMTRLSRVKKSLDLFPS